MKTIELQNIKLREALQELLDSSNEVYDWVSDWDKENMLKLNFERSAQKAKELLESID